MKDFKKVRFDRGNCPNIDRSVLRAPKVNQTNATLLEKKMIIVSSSAQ